MTQKNKVGQERFKNEKEKEQQSSDRMQHRCRNLLRNRQLRSFLPWPDGAGLDFCHFDGGAVGAGGDELHPIEEDELIAIVILPNDN